MILDRRPEAVAALCEGFSKLEFESGLLGMRGRRIQALSALADACLLLLTWWGADGVSFFSLRISALEFC